MSTNPKVTWIGYKTLKEAQRCLGQLPTGYTIAAVTEGAFSGKVLAYVVLHKDVDPLGKPR
jgi:hypothetical protein